MVGELLIALGLRAVAHEPEHPAMRVLEIGEAAHREGAQQIERGRRLAVGEELPLGIGNARAFRELDVVDDVAAIAWQLRVALFFQRRGAGLGELSGDAPDLHDGRGGGVGQHHRHLQKHAEEVADVVGGVLGKGLGAVPALQQERLACRDLGQRAGQIARFAREDERREACDLPLHRRQRGGVPIDGRLLDRLLSPAAGGPTFQDGITPLFPSVASHFGALIYQAGPAGDSIATGLRRAAHRRRKATLRVFSSGA